MKNRILKTTTVALNETIKTEKPLTAKIIGNRIAMLKKELLVETEDEYTFIEIILEGKKNKRLAPIEKSDIEFIVKHQSKYWRIGIQLTSYI